MKIITFILAGGQSQRMGGSNKAAAMLGDSRLIDLVAARLAAQSGHVMISGPQDFETGLTYIPDLASGPEIRCARSILRGAALPLA